MNQLENISRLLDQKVENLVEELVRLALPNSLVRRRKKDGEIVEINLSQDQIRKILTRIKIGTKNECWEWKRAMNGPGLMAYGVQWLNGFKFKTHQLSLQLFQGRYDADLFSLHHCDNPSCCNPFHLYAGTSRQNRMDCQSRGRENREMGSKRYNAKLTEEQVERIKREAPNRTYGWGRRLAREFGVGATAINNIVRGRRWKQLTGPSDAALEQEKLHPKFTPLQEEWLSSPKTTSDLMAMTGRSQACVSACLARIKHKLNITNTRPPKYCIKQ